MLEDINLHERNISRDQLKSSYYTVQGRGYEKRMPKDKQPGKFTFQCLNNREKVVSQWH